MVSKLCAVLCAALCATALAQSAPVEFILVAPPSDLYVVQPVQPDWQAPALLCRLCQESQGDSLCGCARPLTQELAEDLYGATEGLIAQAFSGKLALAPAVRVRVVSADHLKQLGGQPALGLYEEGTIYLSGDLLRRQALGVLAHEYGHAWQYQKRQDIDRVEDLLFEGFAEWVSYRVLAQAGDHQGTEDVMRDPSLYGQGARWYLALEKKSGLDAALNSARHRLRK